MQEFVIKNLSYWEKLNLFCKYNFEFKLLIFAGAIGLIGYYISSFIEDEDIPFFASFSLGIV